MGFFMLGILIASVIGGPLSGGLLELDGVLGLEGWQWLFLGQGLPAIAVGLWVLRALPSSPPRHLARARRARGPGERADHRGRRGERASELHPARRAPLPAHPALRAGRLHDHFASYGTIFWFADIIERIAYVEGIELGLLAGLPDGPRVGRADPTAAAQTAAATAAAG